MANLAFIFPGQGAQSVGMGQAWASSNDAARRLYQQAGDILGYDLARLCFEGPREKLDSTVHSQPALFVTSLAALEVLSTQSPDVVDACQAAAGLSLGEYTALCFAGVFDFEAGLRLVQARGAAMQTASDANPSAMTSILGLDREAVESLCDKARGDEVLQIANFLCPGNLAISGSREACLRAAEIALEMGAMKAIPLAVAGAFHTELMQPAIERLEAALASVTLKTPRIPVVSNVDARPHDDVNEIRRLLIEQVVRPVQWEDSMRYLILMGVDRFVEVGPGRVLRGLLKRIDRKVACEGVME